MIFFFISLAYAHWFFRIAQRLNKNQPALWGIVGFLTFFLPALLSMGSASALNEPKLIASANASGVLRPEFIIPFLVDTASALIIANGITLIVRKIYLDPSWNFMAARNAAAKRKTLALPGNFPWVFVFVYAAFSLIGTIVAVALNPPPPPHLNLPTLEDYNWRVLSAVIQTAGIALLLWRLKGWLPIAIGWAAILTLITLCFNLVLTLKLEVFVPSLFSGLPLKFAFTFLLIAATTLAVRRWGAALPVLIVALLGAMLLLDLPYMFNRGHDNVLSYLSPQITGLFLALSLYGAFLFYNPPKSDEQK